MLLPHSWWVKSGYRDPFERGDEEGGVRLGVDRFGPPVCEAEEGAVEEVPVDVALAPPRVLVPVLFSELFHLIHRHVPSQESPAQLPVQHAILVPVNTAMRGGAEGGGE